MILLEKEINNKKFVLVKNSIIEEKTEAIVNPANEHLAHGGGVAGLISRSGGSEIQKESTAIAPVKTGQSAYTTAGKLPFRCVIHTVGPIYRAGAVNVEKLLESAIYSALELAHKLEIKSLSMPSISTGIFGYPLKPAIKTIVGTIFDFLKQESTLQEVHLCEYSEDKARKIKSIIKKNFDL